MILNNQFADLEDAVTRLAYADYLEERDEEPDFRDHLRQPMLIDYSMTYLQGLENVRPYAVHVSTDKTPFSRWWVRDIIYYCFDWSYIYLFVQLWDDRYAYIHIDLNSIATIIEVDTDYHRLKLDHLISDAAYTMYEKCMLTQYPIAEIIRIRDYEQLARHNQIVGLLSLDNPTEIVKSGLVKIGDIYYQSLSDRPKERGYWNEVTDVSKPRHVCNFYCVRRLTP